MWSTSTRSPSSSSNGSDPRCGSEPLFTSKRISLGAMFDFAFPELCSMIIKLPHQAAILTGVWRSW